LATIYCRVRVCCATRFMTAKDLQANDKRKRPMALLRARI
jgi:hypothetical protein